jgi:Glyoxalase-like domain
MVVRPSPRLQEMSMDHLVYGVPELGEGIVAVERKTGIRADFGGRHPGRGTHNALLSLGDRRYLEIIALDPEQTEAPHFFARELETLSKPKLIAWAVAVDSVVEIAERAKAANIETVGPLSGSRAQSGKLLTWKTLRISAPSLWGLPFFIEWNSGAVHPSETSPSGCSLAAFRIEHPRVEAMSHALASLGVDAVVVPAAHARLRAHLHSPKGEVELG